MSGLCLPGSEPRLRSLLFGFSVFKFFQIVREGWEQHNYLIGARQFGLLLVSIGLISLVPATLQYRQNIRMLDEENQSRPRSLAVIVAGQFQCSASSH
jgi:putative membrane protein